MVSLYLTHSAINVPYEFGIYAGIYYGTSGLAVIVWGKVQGNTVGGVITE